MFQRVALIGLGLMGSSLARAIKKHGLAEHISGMDNAPLVRAFSEHIGFADSVHDEYGHAVREADLVVFCTPLGTYKWIAEAISPYLKRGAIISDVGSCKANVLSDLLICRESNPDEDISVVPGHPVAGAEHTGPEAGSADMFENHYVILTPDAATHREAVETMSTFWRRLGAVPHLMTPEHHDLVLSVTSHLPHLISYAIVGTVFDLETQIQEGDRQGAPSDMSITTQDVMKFSAGGFRDLTRTADSSPRMWRDIFLFNRECVLEMLGRFTEDLIRLQRAVRWSDGEFMRYWFSRAREIRKNIQELSTPEATGSKNDTPPPS